MTGTEGASLGILLPTATDGLSTTTSSGSGLELLSNGLTLLQGCANNEVLSWNESLDLWSCTSIAGVGGVTGSATTGQAAFWSGTSTIAGENQLATSRGGTGVNGSAAANGSLLIGNGTGYTLATLTQGTGITVTNGAGSITIASTLGTSIDLTTEVTGTLPVGNGGTGATTFTANGVLYGNTTGAVQVTAAGTNGQLLLGVTAGAPTFATMSSDATITNAGVLTIAANAVALTTDTTGNYVANVANGNGIAGGSAGSEGAALTLAIDLLDSADGAGAVASNSGLEFQGAGSNELAIIQGCSNGQGISWDDTTNLWQCTSFSAGLAGSGTTGYATYWSGTSSLGSEQFLSTVRGGTGLDGSAAANGTLLIGNGTGYTLSDVDRWYGYYYHGRRRKHHHRFHPRDKHRSHD